MNSLYINGKILTFEDFIERRTGLNVRAESPDELTEFIRVIISWDAKWRISLRSKHRRELSTIYKYAYIKHLHDEEAFTFREIADRMNEMSLRTTKGRLWNLSNVKNQYYRCVSEEIPKDFDPIEWERTVEDAAKAREIVSVKKTLNKMAEPIDKES